MGQEEKYMDEYIKEISEKIEDKKEYYAEISNKIWEYAEPRFQEYKSSELLQQSLKEEEFSIKSNLAGEETAFIAEYGSGKPVIGFLGEFDALPELSQKADAAERIPEEKISDSKYESIQEREKKQNPDSGHLMKKQQKCYIYTRVSTSMQERLDKLYEEIHSDRINIFYSIA